MSISTKKTPNLTNENKKGIPFNLNLVILIITAFIIFILSKKNDGYKWVKDDLIGENLKMIKEFPDADEDDKLVSKFGFDYQYIKILKSTPLNAVILLPKRAVLDTVRKLNNAQQIYPSGLVNKEWCKYYLYPRKTVHEEDLKTSKNTKNISHVAILGGFGFDKLHYSLHDSIKNKYAYSVLPIDSLISK